MFKNYNQTPQKTLKTSNRTIEVFDIDGQDKNIDFEVVDAFGEEWSKFNSFSEKDIKDISFEYFDIVNDEMVNRNTYLLDVGCGSGRFSKYMSSRAGFVEAIDPSSAIFAADKLLDNIPNVRITQASTDNIPFDDNTFDFVMSIGVLHHIPDTQKAMNDCVKKVKSGGYFFTYLYYSLDNRGIIFKFLFFLVNLLRLGVSKLPNVLKKIVCDIIALVIYMPIVLFGRLIAFLGLKKLANDLPLSAYHNLSFFVIRNDALDRFGTKLEQRFSRAEIKTMMEKAGLTDVTFSEKMYYWRAVGKKK
jgi:ubiquinone/menaquinone biosynthesis C-methylase UbiE